MTVLISDTHPLVWYMTAKFNKLPVKVRNAFDKAVDGQLAIFIPAVVLWELSLLIKAGTVQTSITLDDYIKEKFYARAISILDIETEDILLSQKLTFSKDPFDALLVAMTLRLDCPLITGDGIIHKQKPCQIFWH